VTFESALEAIKDMNIWRVADVHSTLKRKRRRNFVSLFSFSS